MMVGVSMMTAFVFFTTGSIDGNCYILMIFALFSIYYNKFNHGI